MECFLSKPVFESSVIYLENRWRREKAWEIGEENKLLIDFFFFFKLEEHVISDLASFPSVSMQ